MERGVGGEEMEEHGHCCPWADSDKKKTNHNLPVRLCLSPFYLSNSLRSSHFRCDLGKQPIFCLSAFPPSEPLITPIPLFVSSRNLTSHTVPPSLTRHNEKQQQETTTTTRKRKESKASVSSQDLSSLETLNTVYDGE